MQGQTVYVILECYPKVSSSAFEQFAGATVGCWVRTDTCAVGQSPESLAQDKLSSEGWTVARVVSSEDVSAMTYASKLDGREYFEQAQLDGFVAHIYVRERECVGGARSPITSLGLGLVAAANEVSRNGGVSFFSTKDQQWANGVTPDGDEFLPMWLVSDDALEWREFWPGYELRVLSAAQLINSDFLDRVDSDGMWIGLAVGGALTMCHARWIKEIASSRGAGLVPG